MELTHNKRHQEEIRNNKSVLLPANPTEIQSSWVGETGASCYRGRLLQGHFMQNYYIDGEIADSSSIIVHQGNHRRNKTVDACELYEIRKKITFYTPETFFTHVHYFSSSTVNNENWFVKKWQRCAVCNVSQLYINDAWMQHAHAFIWKT